MKMLVNQDRDGPELSVQLDLTKEFCRVDSDDDNLTIENMIRAATADVEQFAQISILTKTIRVNIFDPPVIGWSSFTLPIGPVADDHRPTVTIDGLAFDGFEFVGGNRGYIRWHAAYYDLPMPSRVSIEYQAGFGTTAADIPADLAQAIMDQTALHYDGRSPMGGKSLTTSPHMARVGARYRGVKV